MKILSRSSPARAEPYLQVAGAAQNWPDEAANRFAATAERYGTLEEAAEAAGLRVDQLTALIRGRGVPSFPTVARLADGVGVRLQWIWAGEEPMMRAAAHPPSRSGQPAPADSPPATEPRAARAPFVVLSHDEAMQDDDLDAPGFAQIADALAFRTDWLEACLQRDPANLFLFVVDGDAMEPFLRAGDLAMCDRSTVPVSDSGLHAFANGDRIIVRRVQRRLDGGLLLLSDNPLYPPEAVAAADLPRLRVLGSIVWYGRPI